MDNLALADERFATAHLETTPFNPLAPASLAASAAAHRHPLSGRQALQGNIVVGLVHLLATRFPVVRRLAGDQSFLGAARGYVFTQPPRSTSLLLYGEAFSGFLRSLGNSASIEYLADIATLEWARHQTAHAPYVALANLPPLPLRSTKRLRALHVLLHPSVSLVASRFPIVTVWEANRSGGEPPIISRWHAEAALVARPFLRVENRRLPPGGHAFLDALRAGKTIADAVAAGHLAAPDFDVVSNLALLAESNVVAAVH